MNRSNRSPLFLRARLSDQELRRLQLSSRSNSVAVRRSGFGGLGVFTLKAAPKGSVVCYFRGAALSERDIETMSPSEKYHYGRYMICSETGKCCVPLRVGEERPPPSLPPVLSGSLINEACLRPEGDYPANVYVVPSGGVSRAPCPWLQRLFFDWKVVASRNLVPGEELLLCYGPFYQNRKGYTVSYSCLP